MKIGALIAICGFMILILGMTIYNEFSITEEQAKEAKIKSGAEYGKIEYLYEVIVSVYISRLRDISFLTLLSLFVSGIALILSGYAIWKIEKS